jgi:hypothetical protein
VAPRGNDADIAAQVEALKPHSYMCDSCFNEASARILAMVDWELRQP